MKIFISQSGDASLALATALQRFVRIVVPSCDPWISSGIEKGSRWSPEISDRLASADAGLICITRDNLSKPWILFEAGALSRHPKDRLWTVLLDVDHSDVTPPLSQFQHTSCERDDVFKMIESMNGQSRTPRSADDLASVFSAFWNELSIKIDAARDRTVGSAPKRSADDMMVEVLEIVRTVGRRVEALPWALSQQVPYGGLPGALRNRLRTASSLVLSQAAWDAAVQDELQRQLTESPKPPNPAGFGNLSDPDTK